MFLPGEGREGGWGGGGGEETYFFKDFGGAT